MSKTPGYRRRRGYDQGLVTLTDSATRKRRDYWLGPYGSSESRERYHRVIAAWEAGGRRLPDRDFDAGSGVGVIGVGFGSAAAGGAGAAPGVNGTPGPGAVAADGAGSWGGGVGTVTLLVRSYWSWAKSEYSPATCFHIRQSLKATKKLFGGTPAAEFGPNRLRLVREEMLKPSEATGKVLARQTINRRIGWVVAMFRWGAGREMVPAGIHQALRTVEPLKRGKSVARETAPKRPVTREQVEAVRPYLSRQVAALMDLQLLTGARSGEIVKLRPRDIDRSGDGGGGGGVWTVTLLDHKTAHRGRERVIYFGPQAQRVLEPFLDRDDDAYLFSPAEADLERRQRAHRERKTPLKYGNTIGTNRAPDPQRSKGACFTTASYRRAIERACDRAFPVPEPLRKRKGETSVEWKARLSTDQRNQVDEWRKAHRWHPHQLRHAAATNIRREFGLEAAQLALGHSSAAVTDAVYAERDETRVIEVMRRVG